MKIKATAASTFKDYENGWSFSESALRSLAESAKDKPVICMRKKIGIVESATCEAGRVVVVAEIPENEEILNKKLFLVPGGLTDFDTEGDIISKCTAHQFFLTDKPSNQELTPIEIIES